MAHGRPPGAAAARGSGGGRGAGRYLTAQTPATDPVGQTRIAALREGLEKLGWIEGRNIRIDTRWATTSEVESLQRFAKELVALQPDLILTQSTSITATMLQETQTRTIPKSTDLHELDPVRVAALQRAQAACEMWAVERRRRH